MGNLYEQTQTLLYIKDMIILDQEGKPSDSTPLEERLKNHPKDLNPIDSPATVFWHVKDKPPKD